MHHDPASCPCDRLDRRTILKLSLAAGAASLVGGFLEGEARADALTQAQRNAMTPDQIIEMMKQGNERFRRGEQTKHNYLAEQRASAKGQYPAAVMLTCIDSRAPAETIMDLGIGDIFNARVAGNISNDDILGSIEFSCKVMGAKVVLVMGHTGCGAIKGAIDGAQLGNLTALLAKIKPAVDATPYEGDRSSKNYDFVNAVARTNVGMTIENIRRGSAVLSELELSRAIVFTGAMYNLETAKVDFFP